MFRQTRARGIEVMENADITEKWRTDSSRALSCTLVTLEEIAEKADKMERISGGFGVIAGRYETYGEKAEAVYMCTFYDSTNHNREWNEMEYTSSLVVRNNIFIFYLQVVFHFTFSGSSVKEGASAKR